MIPPSTYKYKTPDRIFRCNDICIWSNCSILSGIQSQASACVKIKDVASRIISNYMVIRATGYQAVATRITENQGNKFFSDNLMP